MSRRPTRRLVVAGGIGGIAGLAAVGAGLWAQRAAQPRARVRILRETDYSPALESRLTAELEAFPAVVHKARGGRVLLKPNLVEFHADRPVNTDPRLIVALAEAFRRHGAREVLVGEGPGHVRDTEAVLEASGLEALLAERGLRFVDLNIDEVTELVPAADLGGHGRLPIARSVRQVDVLVSVPKLKVHHHTGVTLGMKNLFGTVPGAIWGWPKNPLHWGGIENAIVDLATGLDPDLVVVDGIVGMEGDGPIRGTAVAHGMVLLGEQACAVDAAAARLMGIAPESLAQFQLAARHGGTVAEGRITLEGDRPVVVDYALPERFRTARPGERAWLF